ncbi:MAG: carboxypeptidase-like regulatory domain-containing protein, partial [Candidatus Kuenenia stuttgartiensis]|nr:carboxypeptidase-like regulatory domain-containing protein [Candidatus Kuenenia stuttgartiensis]
MKNNTIFLKNSAIITLAILFFTHMLSAQTNGGIIKGFVYDKSTGEPMIFTNVLLQGTKMGAQTDVDGYFTISQVPEGTYTIVTTLIGYDTFKSSVSIKNGSIITKKIFLSQKETELEGVEITAR